MKYLNISWILLILFINYIECQDWECEGESCVAHYFSNLIVINSACKFPRLAFRGLKENVIPVGTFRLCHNTKMIDLAHNGIKVIKAGAFLDLPKLQELYLSNNDIEYIEPGTFHTLTLLNVLVLTGNKIRTIPKYEIRSTKLKYFGFNSNNFEYIPESVTQKLITTDFIDLSYNKLEKLHPQAFINLEPGFMFMFNHNRLKTLAFFFNESIFMNHSQLQAIGNLLETLSYRTLGELHKMNIVSLDVSFNFIVSIQDDVLSKYTVLKTLYLSHNRIEYLEKSTFAGLTSMILLDLSYNRIQSWIFEMEMPVSAVYFNYSHNQITSLVDFKFIAHSTKRIVHMNLDYNRINFLDTNLFCSHIQRISISGNNWYCSVLYSVIKNLERRNIRVDPGYNFLSYNFNGIACKPDYLWNNESLPVSESLWKRLPTVLPRFNVTTPSTVSTSTTTNAPLILKISYALVLNNSSENTTDCTPTPVFLNNNGSSNIVISVVLVLGYFISIFDFNLI